MNKKIEKRQNINFHTKEIEMSYENLEAAVLQWLQANRLIPLEWNVMEIDFGIPVNEKGLVELNLAYVIPREEESPVKLAVDNTKISLFDT